MGQLRIAYLSVFPPFRGGIAQFNQELYQALGQHAKVKIFNFSRQYPQLLFPGKSQYVENKNEKKWEGEVVLDSVNPLTYWRTVKKINDFEPDVLLIPYWMPFFSPSLGKVASKVKASKKVALLHNVIPHERRFFDHALNRYFLKQFDRFVVLSQTVEGQLRQYLPSAKTLICPHPLYRHFGAAIDSSRAKLKLGIPLDRKVVLFFGFIRKYKGLDLLLKSLAHIPEPVQILIAGESYMDYGEIEDLIRTEGIEPNSLSQFIRFVGDDEVKIFFSASNVCVLPYRSATQSGIAAIAKHFEIPMVVTSVGELPNEVIHEQTGFVCTEVSPESIALGIENCLANEEAYRNNQKEWNAANSFDQFALKLIDFI